MSVLRAGRVAPTGYNQKRRAGEAQAGRGFRAPRRRGGRASTAVDRQDVVGRAARVEVVAREDVARVGDVVREVTAEDVARVEPVVARVELEQARIEPEVHVADEVVVEERVTVVVEEVVVHDTNTTTGASTKPSVHTDEAYPGGPSDKSILTAYADHVAFRIWQDERPMLKLTSHGSMLKNFPEGPMLEKVARIIRDFHLLDFDGCSLTMLDAPLLLAFVERWHPETSSFHLLFWEMTVTLDDVHALFHLPIAGTFFTPVNRDQTTAMQMVRDALEFDELVVLKEFGDTWGFHLRMSWLRKVYQQLVDAGRYEAAARAYMLHLVACTLFADKYAYYIDVHYLTPFSDLDTPCMVIYRASHGRSRRLQLVALIAGFRVVTPQTSFGMID
ncbi:protein MAIN-LIKE 1-like [Vicia villosa]|uniref:protein MAIN-LIKE 1-like n=1 Tax=Vicia villosa TaxID=3911 RepID=UPI00273C5083|nr:protein MAIN-LIKE 1-like [Vicia villosa]